MIWLKLGGVLVVIILAVTYHEFDRGRAYSEGEMTERQKWQEQRDKDLAVAEADRRAKQQQLDAIKATYSTDIASLKATNSQLISEIEQKAAEDEKAATADAACHCAPAVSSRVRDSLQSIRGQTPHSAHQ